MRLAPPLLAAVLLAAACGDDGVTDPPEVLPEPSPLVLDFAPEASGNNQAGLRHTELPQPLRVVVLKDGKPVPGIEVSWEVITGPLTGEVTPLGPTDAAGIASATLRLGPPGAPRVRASIPDHPTRDFNAISEPGKVEVVSGAFQVGQVDTDLGTPVRVRLHYRGTPLPGETLVWTGPGTITGGGVTNDAGEATAHLRLGTRAGTQSFPVVAALDHPRHMTVVYQTGLPGPATRVTWMSFYAGVVGTNPMGYPDGGGAIRTTDAHDNAVAATDIEWRVVSGSATLAQAPAVSDSTGVAWVQFYAESSLAPIILAVRIGEHVEYESPQATAWDMQFSCPWYCGLSPASITRPAGQRIRFDQSGWSICKFATPVAGLPEVVPTEFTIPTPGTYTIACADTGSGPVSGVLVVTP